MSKKAPADYAARVKAGTLDAVIVVPPDFHERWLAHEETRVELVFDDSRTESSPAIRQSERLLDAFNREYDDPTPGPQPLAARLRELIADGDTLVLVAQEADEPIGLAVVRLHKAIWTLALEAYLAELYVVPERQGRGAGQSLMRAWLDRARDLGADYAYVITSEDDIVARFLYAKNGFRRTEGEDGPLMCALEREL